MGNDEKRGKRKDDAKEDIITGTIFCHNERGKKKKMDLTDQDKFDYIEKKVNDTDFYYMAGINYNYF